MRFNKFILVFSFTIFSFLGLSQTLVSTRTAPLMGTPSYTLSGNAILEKYSDGSLKLSLDNSYNTQSGPDVQIFLANSLTATSPGNMVANVGTGPGGISHFSGAITFPIVSGSININTYQNIIFQCVQFGVLWGNGTFGPEVFVTPPPNCSSSLVLGPNSNLDVHICPSDGIPDNITFMNTATVNPNSTYEYILTNDFGQILQVLTDSSFDFEGSPDSVTRRIYGVSVDGILNYSVGGQISMLTATNCAVLSINFIQIITDGCSLPTSCENSIILTSNGDSLIHVCPTDGVTDSIYFVNDLILTTDSTYAYILTDDLGNITQLLTGNSFDFEGSAISVTMRIYGVSFIGNLGLNIGDPISSVTGTTCAVVSSDYIEVITDDCPTSIDCVNSTVMHANGIETLHICPTDGQSDLINFTNSIGVISSDSMYAYFITNELNELIQVINGDNFDFETSPDLVTRHVYGVFYNGVLNYTIGMPIDSIFATDCAIVSSNYLEVVMDDCINLASINNFTNQEQDIVLWPNPVQEYLNISKTLTFVQIYNAVGALVFQGHNLEGINVNDFEEGLYILVSDEKRQQFIVLK